LVTESRVAKLTRWNVALFPAFAVCFAVLLTEQPELHAWSLSKSFVLADEPVIQPYEHNLLTNIASLFADEPELQSNVTRVFAELVILAFESKLQSNEPKISRSKSRLLGFLLTDESFLVDLTILQSDFACLLANEPQLFAVEPQLHRSLAALLVDYAKLQPIEPQVHSHNTAVLTIESKLFDTKLLAKLSIILAELQVQPLESQLQPDISIALRFSSIHAAKSNKLLLTDEPKLSSFPRRRLQSNLQPQKHKVFADKSRLQPNIARVSRRRPGPESILHKPCSQQSRRGTAAAAGQVQTRMVN
jgi:hypothetical protein